VGRFLLACRGGALGSGTRYLVGGYLAGWQGAELPYGTLATHATVSLFLAGFAGIVAARAPADARRGR